MTDSEVSLGLNTNVDQTAPVSSTQTAQGRTSAGDGENRQRKRPAAPAEEKIAAESVDPDSSKDDARNGDEPQHEIDSLA